MTNGRFWSPQGAWLPAVMMTLVVVAALASPGRSSAEEGLQGTLRDGGDHWVLHVWGSPYEMGYAHGFLMGEEIMEFADGYAFQMFSMTPAELDAYAEFFLSMMDIPGDYWEEGLGIIDGIEASGVSLYLEAMDREVTVDDLMLTNAAADIFGIELGCSSVSAWGDATSWDPELAGESAIARDLDWSFGNGDADIRDFGLVIAYDPAAAGQQRWVSIAFPGFIGCLSCFNASGIGAFQNQGNHDTQIGDLDITDPPMPINLAMRSGIQALDADGDGTETIDDVVHAVTSVGRLGDYDIHLISPADRSDPPAAILEAVHAGWELRLPAEDPLPAPQCVAATNHHRELFEPADCYRYDIIEEMIGEYGGELDGQRLWEIEGEVSQFGLSHGTVQTMRFIPSTLRLDVAFSSHEAAAPYESITAYEMAWFYSDGGPAEVGDDDDADDGCQCANTGYPTTGPLWAVMLALVAWLRRKR